MACSSQLHPTSNLTNMQTLSYSRKPDIFIWCGSGGLEFIVVFNYLCQANTGSTRDVGSCVIPLASFPGSPNLFNVRARKRGSLGREITRLTSLHRTVKNYALYGSME